MLVFDIEEFHERFEELVEMAAAGNPFEVHSKGERLLLVTAVDGDADTERP